MTADSVLVSSTRTARIETSGDVTLTTTGAGTSTLYGTIAHDGEIRLQLAGDLRLYGAITDNGRVAISTGRYRLFAGYSLGANAACVLTGTVLAGSVPLVGCSGPLVEN